MAQLPLVYLLCGFVLPAHKVIQPPSGDPLELNLVLAIAAYSGQKSVSGCFRLVDLIPSRLPGQPKRPFNSV
jgi:hypothetical protein